MALSRCWSVHAHYVNALQPSTVYWRRTPTCRQWTRSQLNAYRSRSTTICSACIMPPLMCRRRRRALATTPQTFRRRGCHPCSRYSNLWFGSVTPTREHPLCGRAQHMDCSPNHRANNNRAQVQLAHVITSYFTLKSVRSSRAHFSLIFLGRAASGEEQQTSSSSAEQAMRHGERMRVMSDCVMHVRLLRESFTKRRGSSSSS